MYQNILVAFDGSELSEQALAQAADLAKAIRANVTALTVTIPWSSVAVGEVAVMFPPEEYERNAAKTAEARLGRAAELVQARGLECATVHKSDAQPHRAIVDTAAEKGCDLIVMGSHGRRGLAGLLLGSVAAKTLSHAHVPVLVFRV